MPSMVKFKLSTKGKITQWFGGNGAVYQSRGTDGHSGIDSVLGWNKPVVSDNAAFVYKTIFSHQSKENWQAVYMLVHDKEDEYVEVCQGHLNEIKVKEGQTIKEHAVIGLEGNKGFVRSGGVVITPEMQKAGDQRGTHTHTSYRPVRKVKRRASGKEYLLTVSGSPYKDADGCLYEIIHQDNGMRGCVDPLHYKYENTIVENLTLITSWFKLFKK